MRSKSYYMGLIGQQGKVIQSECWHCQLYVAVTVWQLFDLHQRGFKSFSVIYIIKNYLEKFMY